MMLELRPNCECCDRDLPPSSLEAMICSFECTFCTECVNKILFNVCPNYGGGFTQRPIRPKKSLEKYPASVKRMNQAIDPVKHAAFAESLKHGASQDR